ncbi:MULTISPECIES: glucose-1-phosphate adenylyltransferase subunit GlgD [Paenibacillus]|jgi:glucose-1-phosphate adenylyltransferase|uniref:Glucose-1-phosphate adenylyltransferase subunit GlgD n=1 Tax=Paenibacillus odorifer TaxID=189426 RepID=A0ABX3GGV5_9BACL|nr:MULTISPECIES: glucose-1-phosphate adenylyltransferase subunit GlgD [Paenibacillus]AIQ72313.1 glucose-1-phosphate adenylyltransferase subunit GlgD [Paenibacillus odorifer]ETT67722.1 glycogen biosynthesis protein GlgD [Paenibacillus sp. FSL H8-237]MDH6429177.1 glucose-1-phosphate adenylyltransferase [Paenibacillus sp. PastH-4]MDH6445384.1 glucose-1-phosphate adenylyltransferase [Paenibacillus sp. PastF-4]MDH6529272.1 glucose-1-phosphate adenylyltransferase [Paenibacillus sp. PastH-3]
MKQLMGVINLDHELDKLNELTYFRCGAAVPFASRYRLIDFVLSNMMRADLESVGLFVRRKYRSLMDHLGDGKSWDMNRKHGGLFILPPDWNDPTDTSLGDLQHYHNNLDLFKRGSAKYIVFSGSQHINTIDLQDLYSYHLEKGADVTVVYKKIEQLQPEHELCQRIEVDEENNVTNIHHEKDHPNLYLDIFIMEKKLFLEQVEHCIAHGESYFFRDVIQKNRHKFKIAAYEYHGYHAVINSLESYYKNSLELLQQENYFSLFKESPVQTKIKYEAPTRYLESANVSNSLVANGCIIAGTVENSVIFRGVQVRKGAKIINSVIMQKCIIEEDAVIENVIMDKDVHLSKNRILVGDSKRPFVIAKSSKI